MRPVVLQPTERIPSRSRPPDLDEVLYRYLLYWPSQHSSRGPLDESASESNHRATGLGPRPATRIPLIQQSDISRPVCGPFTRSSVPAAACDPFHTRSRSPPTAYLGYHSHVSIPRASCTHLEPLRSLRRRRFESGEATSPALTAVCSPYPRPPSPRQTPVAPCITHTPYTI